MLRRLRRVAWDRSWSVLVPGGVLAVGGGMVLAEHAQEGNENSLSGSPAYLDKVRREEPRNSCTPMPCPVMTCGHGLCVGGASALPGRCVRGQRCLHGLVPQVRNHMVSPDSLLPPSHG